ncbi:MAG: hypothetical protein E7218_06005 [Anaerofustis stercorihominis]|nr:hypothetical protein [Anaerofustis stercorihominis]
MRTFVMKTVSLLLVIFLVVLFVPTSIADSGVPRIVLKADSDYYKEGDVVMVDIMLYDVKASTIEFCVVFDGNVIAPGEDGAAVTRGDVLSGVDIYDRASSEGIFSYIPKFGLASGAGENCYFFAGVYVDPYADESNIKNGKIVDGHEGYKLGTLTFRALKEGRLPLSFGTGIFKDSDGKDYLNFTAAGYDLGDTEGETYGFVYENTPYADAQEKAGQVRYMIDDLTCMYDDGFDGLETRINEAEEAYNGMSELERRIFIAEYWTQRDVQRKIAEARDRLYEGRTEEADNEAIRPVEEMVNALRDADRFTDADELERMINETEESFAELTSQQQSKLKQNLLDLNEHGGSSIRYENIISEAKARAEELRKINAVESLINEIGNVTLSKEGVIDDARKAYNTLSDEQKLLVENGDILKDAKKKLAELKAEIENVNRMIGSLPEIISHEDADSVIAARNAYNKLTDEQRSFVTNADKLKAAEAVLADYLESKKAEDAIAELPDEATFVFEENIHTVKASYDALTEEQKALVANADKLESLIAELESKQSFIDDYIAEYGDTALIIDDQTGYIEIITTLVDLLTPEDKDFIVEGQIVVYSVSGISNDVTDEPFYPEPDILDGKKPFSRIYSIVVEKGIAETGEAGEFVVSDKQTVSAVPGTITVKFTVPEDMLLSSENTTRTFSAYVGLMAENYDPVWADDLDNDADTITFAVSGSAEFLPAYIDTTNPATNDSIIIYAVTLMLIVLTAAVVERKRAV